MVRGFVKEKKLNNPRANRCSKKSDGESDDEITFESRNQFASLESSISDDDDKNSETCKKEDTGSDKKVRMPTIVVYTYIKDHLATLNELSKDLEKGISVSVKRNRIVMYTKTSNDYNTLLAKIKAAQIQFHTYTIQDQKPLMSILKGLAPNITEDEVKSDLERQGFKNTVVKQFTSKIEQEKGKTVDVKLPIFSVKFEPKTKISEVKKVKFVLQSALGKANFKKKL